MSSAFAVEPSAIIDIIGATTGYKMSARRAALFSKVLAGEYPALYDQMNSVVTQLGQVMANRFGIGWTGNTHTADFVGILALGPGAEHFAGFVQNTDVFVNYTQLAGIDFKNPSLPLIASVDGPEADEVERSERYAWV
jgi:alkaline phosphatase